MLESFRNLRLKLKPGRESRLLPIFQQGICVRTRLGLPLARVLEEVGFTGTYLVEKVQTVFLDGSAVDNLDGAIVKGGSVIALSAAMPGLAGAILRKGSPISGLRSNTSAAAIHRSVADVVGTVRLKLFNRVAEEMGPQLLHKGILLKRSDFENFVAGRPGLLEKEVLEAQLDSTPLSPAELLGGKSIPSDYFVLKIVSLSSSD